MVINLALGIKMEQSGAIPHLFHYLYWITDQLQMLCLSFSILQNHTAGRDMSKPTSPFRIGF